MNATATAPATRVNVFVGSGRKVHVAYTAPNGQASTVCGAERRGVGVTYTRKTDAPVTCLACAPTTEANAAEVAPLEVVTLDGEELTVEVAATEGTHTFTASPADSRRCTCGKSRNVKVHGYTPSRGAGRAAAEKLADAEAKQEQAAATVQAAEDAVAAVYANFAVNRQAAQAAEEESAAAERRTAALISAADIAAAEGRTEEAARLYEKSVAASHPAAPIVQRVALGTFREQKPAAKAVKVKAPKEEAPAPTAQIGKGVVRFTLTTEAAGTVAYTSGSQINRDYALALAEGRPAVLRTIKGHIIRQH